MTIKNDAKFKEKLMFDSKYGMRDYVNSDASSCKSKSFLFDVLLLTIAYKVSAKKVKKSYLS